MYAPAEDPFFGVIDIELDRERGTLRVSGGEVPPVEVRRAPDTPPETHVPIGTRDPARLTLLVDGAEEVLRPAKGFLARRSYRVEVAARARQCGYVLVPGSETAPEPYDASVGYALATAFGTGAEPMWKLTLNAALEMWP
ncbi:hypothetical protein HTV80_15405 [Streptomyces sp. Vc74B-19]|uniref:hypothetical protein n=1 Tax=unclassified Streptomyces TaxID=2593676 RepID=UPI001BFC441D|nr:MULTISPECIES: hypothetical protein [unclassified Streptomyces]MBT3164485.1 hypothetical protein [Streptomyces sp. Vc74B-19]MCO4696286.1 hypothetical protein [Streptomyces sp. RO-S4]